MLVEVVPVYRFEIVIEELLVALLDANVVQCIPRNDSNLQQILLKHHDLKNLLQQL